LLCAAQILQSEARQQSFETLPMQHVELGKGLPAGAHFLQSRLVLAAPGVGKSRPIELILKVAEDFFTLPGDRRAPVHHGPEHVEKQGLDRGLASVHGANSLLKCAGFTGLQPWLSH
jgi:hypothetical protein